MLIKLKIILHVRIAADWPTKNTQLISRKHQSTRKCEAIGSK